MRHAAALALLAVFFAVSAHAKSPVPLSAPLPAPSDLDDEVTAPTVEQRAREKYAADTAVQRPPEAAATLSSLTPRPPELERLAEREAQQILWDQQLPATQAQLMDEAKRNLEQGHGHAAAGACMAATPKASGSKEMDAIQAALKRIRRLPAEDREPARRELRACIDHAVPPPGAVMPASAPPPVAPPTPRLSPAQQERCRFKGLFGC